MKILIITQVVDKNNSVLGFFCGWINEFAKQCEKVTVVCLEKGDCALPDNVKVLSLGKEKGNSKLKYIFNFYKYIWNERNNYDFVFVHMNPEYVVLGAVVWRFLKKRVSLWYTHGTVTLKLKLATFLSDIIFTASKKSFRIQSEKVKVVGHGINTDAFSFDKKGINKQKPKLVSIGRISKIKRQDLAVKVLGDLKKEGIDAELFIVGEPLTEDDRNYKIELELIVEKNNLKNDVKFFGSVSNNDLPKFLQGMDVLVHTSETGSLDKVVLEAMSAGVVVLSTSSAVHEVLPSEYLSKLGMEKYNDSMIDVLVDLFKKDESRINEAQRIGVEYIKGNHNLDKLISRIIFQLSQKI
jgi:glycosyltransferase involved in cell wall biosynthesis